MALLDRYSVDIDWQTVCTILLIRMSAICRYVHRVGRTGRGGKSGTAVSLLTPEDAEFAERLTKEISPSKEQLALRVDQGGVFLNLRCADSRFSWSVLALKSRLDKSRQALVLTLQTVYARLPEEY